MSDESRNSPERPRRPRSLLWRVVRGALLVYLAVALLLFVLQRRFMYFPSPGPVPVPGGDEYRGLREVELEAADDVALRAWFWPGRGGATVVLFHGNAGHRGHRLEWLTPLHEAGYGLFLLDYRGYGGSEGSPSETGLYRDGEAALDWLEDEGITDLVYLGESIGCGVAVEMAVRRRPRALILQSGYTSLAEVAQRHYPFLPVKLLLRDRYRCVEKIGRISCPLLMIHGARDEIIPVGIARRLFDAAAQPKEWFEVERGDHNGLVWVEPAEYYRRVLGFLKSSLEGGGR